MAKKRYSIVTNFDALEKSINISQVTYIILKFEQSSFFSGDMSHMTDTNSRQFVAESGRAYVFFYSDSALNMSGFNISFR